MRWHIARTGYKNTLIVIKLVLLSVVTGWDAIKHRLDHYIQVRTAFHDSPTDTKLRVTAARRLRIVK